MSQPQSPIATPLQKLAEVLEITLEEAKDIVIDSFNSNDPFSTLTDLLGYENIELIFDLYKYRESYADQRNEQPTFIEHTIPETPPRPVDPATLVETGPLKAYFPYDRFNPVQSAVFNDVYTTDGNVLVAAPTGAGKTDIALLAVLRALKYDKAQVIYIVPMKALASEIFNKYSRLLGSKIPVIEYTGDTEIDGKTASNARLVVCTPEKFDAATRRLNCIFQHIRLVIIDEIHLLEDDRGPVVEAIVSRMFRISELRQTPIRLVGLSATLPNYQDVAVFIKATHVHFFDQSYRPVPLKMTVTGFTKVSRYSDEQEYLLEKTQAYIDAGKQVLVFVHSRAKTHKVALFLVKSLRKSTDEPCSFGKISTDLHQMVTNRVGIHHAGLSKQDRRQMETLFSSGALKVLVTTSTLAWGVNLPAYAVIIHGHTFYNPQLGGFADVSILDVLQIFGRAGRPQYDSKGEAILMATADKIDKYIGLLKRSKSIESKMLFHVPEMLNSEIYLGTVSSIATALSWIKNTFLYVRMLQHPAQYGIPPEEIGFEEQALSDYIYLTLKRLEDCRLIEINRRDSNYNTWLFKSTFCGQMASLYYIKHLTMYTLLGGLPATMNEMSLISLLIKAEEFKPISIRAEEVTYLARLHEDILLRGGIHFDFDETPESKLLILLISFINYQRMQIFSLTCDTDFIVENMKRLLAAVAEMLLHFKLYDTFLTAFALEKKLHRYRRRTGKKLVVEGVRITDRFVDLRISEVESPSTVILKADGQIFYAFRIYKSSNHIVVCKASTLTVEVHTNEGWDVSTVEIQPRCDYSPWGLYKYGIHCCDTTFRLAGARCDCVHFESQPSAGELSDLKSETFGNAVGPAFTFDIQFVEIEACNLREILVMMTNQIEVVESTGTLIVCPFMSDVRATQLLLNAQAGLKGNNVRFGAGPTPRQTSRHWICTFKEALKIQGFDRVVMKGIGTGDGIFPIYEVLKICENRKATIYETANTISYLKSVLQCGFTHRE